MSGSRVVITADILQALREFDRFRAQATGALESVSAVGSKLNGLLGALGVTLSVAAFTGWIKGAIDAGDAANELSQKTGLLIGDVAGVELAYQQAGLGSEVMVKSMAKLSLGIANGSETFARLGIASKQADGSLRSTKDVLYEVADRFAGMEEGAQKTALAMDLFGKSGFDMLPLLNGGAEGLRDMDEMAQKLGLTISEKTAKEADSFNDTLELLQMGGQGVARGVAAELLPTLSRLAGVFLNAMTSGDKLKNVAHFLAMGLKVLFTVGFGIVEVFSTVGKTLGAAGAQLVALWNGDFKKAAEIGRAWQADIGASWKDTAKSIQAVWSDSSDASVDAMVAMRNQSSLVGQSAAEVAKRTKAANKELAEDARLLAEMAGLSGTFAADWDRLSKAHARGVLTTDQLIKAQAELLAKQPAMKAAIEAEQKARGDLAKFNKDYAASLEMLSKLGIERLEDAEKEALANEELARTFGMTKSAIEQLEVARLEEQLAQRVSTGLTLDEIDTIEKLIAAKKRSVAALGELDVKEAAQKFAGEGVSAAVDIGKSLTDALLRGFEAGKGFGKNLVDTVRNMFNTLVLRPVISAVVNPAAGAVTGALGLSGPASAAGSSSMGSAIGGAVGSIFGAGGLAGSIAAGAGWLTGATTLGGSLAAAGSLAATGTLGGIASSIGMVAGALGPIALALGAAVAIWKKLDTSGTSHMGGAASADAAGVRTIRAESIGFEYTKTNADTEKMVSTLAQGMVGILDSTALTFGKTAGYTAATAFADDTSKDGAWGALLIKKMGATVLDWDSTRTSKWAPKEFADGEAGQKQYLAALSSSVRTALDGIGLPGWAQKMLDGLGSGAAIEDLAKVVDQINLTQRALVAMKGELVGFASLSDTAVSALMAASGGIEALAGNARTYFDAFYSEGEKSASTIKTISDLLASVGVSMPATHEAFRAQVEAEMALGEARAPAVAMLFKVAGAFDQVVPKLEQTAAAARSAADILGERTDLQKQLNELTMTEAQRQAQDRAAIHESNRALYDQVVLQRELKASTAAASEALRGTVERLTATRTSSLAYRDSLLLGSLSTLTPMQKYLETQRQYTSAVQKAFANPADSAAASAAQEAATAWLSASQVINASSAAYVGDNAKVLNDMDRLAEIAGAQMTDAQLQLSALDRQVAGIDRVNDTLSSIEQAIRNPGAALPLPAPDFNLQRYAAASGAAGDVLATEVKALRAEVVEANKISAAALAELARLRTDTNRNAGILEDATGDAGAVVAKAVGVAIEQATHLANNPTKVSTR